MMMMTTTYNNATYCTTKALVTILELFTILVFLTSK